MAIQRKFSSSSPRTALIVLGMHRSGTSALAGVLSKMGADLPHDLMAPNETNPKGFFESQQMMNVNDSLLDSAGLIWSSFNPVSEDWFASPKAEEYMERAIEAIEAEYGRSRFFIMKDPRMCRLLPFWHEALEATGCAPLHVCPHRHPRDVAASLTRWANYEPEYGLLLWLRHVLEAEAASRGHARTFTSYEQLMTDWVQLVKRIGSQLDLKWPKSPQSIHADVGAFLSKELHHFHQTAETKAAAPALPDGVAEVYEILESWAANGEDKNDYERLDHIQKSIQELGTTMSPALWRGQEQHVRIGHLNKQVSNLETTVQEDKAREAASAAATAAERQALNAARARVGELEQAFGTSQNEIQTLQAKRAEDANALNAVQARTQELEQALGTSQNEIQTLQAKRAEDASALNAAQERTQELEQALGTSQNEIQTLQAKRAEDASALNAAQERTQELEQALGTSQNEIQALQAKRAEDANALNAAQERTQELEQALQTERNEAEAKIQSRDQAANKRYNNLQANHEALQKDYDVLKQKLEQEAKERDQLESRLAQSRAEASDFHKQTIADAQLIADLQEKVTKSDQDYKKLDKQYKRDKQHLKAMTNALSSRMFDVVDLKLNKKDDKDTEEPSKGLQKALEDAQKKLENAKHEITILSAKNLQASSQQALLANKNRQLAQSLKENEDKIEALKRENNDKEKYVNAASQSVIKHQLKIKELQGQPNGHQSSPVANKKNNATNTPDAEVPGAIQGAALRVCDSMNSLLYPEQSGLLRAFDSYKRKIDRLKKTEIFDAEWYIQHYTDVAEAGFDAYSHYVRFGVKEGRAPNSKYAAVLDAARQSNEEKANKEQ